MARSPPTSSTPPFVPKQSPPPAPGANLIVETQPKGSVPVECSSNEAKLQSKIIAMESKIAALEAQLAENQAKEEELRGKLKTPFPETTVQNHITLLHTYNQIRDIGSGLMGIIAENRGVRVRDVFLEFGVGEAD